MRHSIALDFTYRFQCLIWCGRHTMLFISIIADTLVKDYLLFRGFTSSFSEFNREREQDRVQKFNVEKIVQQIKNFITRFALWKQVCDQ